jgi:hypothetical protein
MKGQWGLGLPALLEAGGVYEKEKEEKKSKVKGLAYTEDKKLVELHGKPLIAPYSEVLRAVKDLKASYPDFRYYVYEVKLKEVV